MKAALAALASLFLAAHLAFLPPTLADIDSVNFALGVRDFDIARHQPHPPGYPVYVALAKATAAVLGGASSDRAVILALSVWSAIAGAALLPLLFVLFRTVDGADGSARRAWWATGIAVACPLFWFNALRPLSDMTGLAVAVAAQWLTLAVVTGRTGRRRGTLLLIAGVSAGVAAGIRAQTVMLTAPLLAVALIVSGRAVSVRARLAAVTAALAGALVWLAPLLAASGGLEGYLSALGTQAGEDFGGVVMLWTTRTPRAAVDALIYSFVWPWGGPILGGLVVAAASVGALRSIVRDRAAIVWLGLAFGPYAVFHLLFHETATVRYALPLVVPVAFLVSNAFDWAGSRAGAVLSAALVVVMLGVAAPAARQYGSLESPPFRALRDVREEAGSSPIGMHAVFRRSAEWQPPGPQLLQARHGREWLALVARWREEPGQSMAFVADPRRTDLALFDRHARELKGSYRWTFPERPYVAGVRPGNTDWYLMRPPGWMLDRGWSLSAELGGVAARDAAGPHVRPSVAWVRSRSEQALLMIGGRNLDAATPAEVTVARGEHVIDRWNATPGFFFRLAAIGDGILGGGGYVPVSVTARSADNQVRVSLEQFDLQSDGTTMVGLVEGWHEPEYSPAAARAWRWMGERAVLWVRPVGREVTLMLTGESPLRYFATSPNVRLMVAGQELARFSPSDDFTERVILPDNLLRTSDGRVLIESNQWFVPADRGESADRRHLALRIYQVDVR